MQSEKNLRIVFLTDDIDGHLVGLVNTNNCKLGGKIQI